MTLPWQDQAWVHRRRPGFPAPINTLAQDDFHAPVLRFTHAISGGHQGIGLTKAARDDFIALDTPAQQFCRHRIGAAKRQRLIILWRAGTVRIAIHLNPGDLLAGAGLGSFADDLPGAVGQVSLVPIKKTR